MLDFFTTSQLEIYFNQYVQSHTYAGKFKGDKNLRKIYYKIKQHNLQALKGGLEKKIGGTK